MSHIRQLPRPITTMRGEPDKVIVDIDFRKGLDYGAAYDRLEPGYAFFTGNMMPESRGMTPRSGLTGLYPDTKSVDTVGYVHGAWQAKDKVGTDYAYIFAGNDLQYNNRAMWHISGKAPEWRRVTTPYLTWGMRSQNTYGFTDFTYIYDPNKDENIGVITNNEDYAAYFPIGSGSNAISNFTDESLMQRAATVCAADERLVFANVDGSDGRVANRVVWTVRGNPRNFTISQGAGFQDITEARGPFTKIIAEGEGFLLFTDSEIWRANPRRDTYAFDFSVVSPELGLLNPRTVVRSPFGVIFVGTDSEVYTLSGNQLRNISWKDDHSRISFLLGKTNEPRRMHAVYDRVKKQYILFYVSSSIYPYGEDYPVRAFVYDFNTDSWWWWFLPEEISAATVFYQENDVATSGATWDDQGSKEWDSDYAGVTWDNVGMEFRGESKVVAVAGGQFMTFSDKALCDSRASLAQTQEIYAEWSSHGHTVPGKLHYYSRLESAYIEYNFWPVNIGQWTGSHSLFTVGGGREEIPIRMNNTNRSGLSYAYAPIDDSDRAPIFDFYFSQNSYTSRPVWVRAQTIVSNGGEFLG